MTVAALRKKHPRFVYRGYNWKIEDDSLRVVFDFLLEPDIVFQPKIIFSPLTQKQLAQIDLQQLENWIFHLGLIELFSYWKTAASPEIIIQAGELNPDQCSWWQEVLIDSMGEFFYTNQIDFRPTNFVKFINKTEIKNIPDKKELLPKETNSSSYLIPVVGGKDSGLLLNLLDEAGLTYDILLSFPQSPAAQNLASKSLAKKVFTIERIFDPQLFALNKAGYLNGHTPFSARLAFESSLLAFLAGHNQILVANEFSANEGNVPYKGTIVNHQYSKTFDFENKFRKYVSEFINKPENNNPEYLSILRPLTELQIAGLFAQAKQFHATFRSCNRGQQQNIWCCECPKCLFVFTVLYPFLTEQELIGPIFPENLFAKESMVKEANALMGRDANKPFECVGTHEETQAAFFLSIKKFQKLHPNQKLPIVLDKVWKDNLQNIPDLEKTAKQLLCFWNNQHNLNEKLTKIIQTAAQQLCEDSKDLT